MSLEDEWESIAAKTDEFRREAAANKGKVKAQNDIMSQPCSLREVQQWVRVFSAEHGASHRHDKQVEEDEDGSAWCKATSRSPGPDSLAKQEKALVAALRAAAFDFNEPAHFRMLRTMYAKLSRSKMCPSIGRHWEVMGFQNTDPRMDLNRSGGVLNVIHMFYFFSKYFEILKAAFQLAQDFEQNFPLFCVSINITAMVIEAFLNGFLSSVCDSGGGVFDGVCKVYCSGLFPFYWQWRSQKRTIRDAEATFKEVRGLLENAPRKLLDQFEKAVVANSASCGMSENVEFADLDAAATAAGLPPSGGSFSLAVPRRLRNYEDTKDSD